MNSYDLGEPVSPLVDGTHLRHLESVEMQWAVGPYNFRLADI
ncbi:hypothetical protein Bphyt_6530 [Paraburkholderia phytofirmans PsJN]|uniref:Uncharacterized protein n=1 Tax=Paraburkholderia phytofirmans (strain DSM 17436 / LMG 22146 / PsJN) TaxID=398527 RepID=B2TB91_PARPJ|nr:hypothetical protein Bphyt_6530 [Paraburkholderia phytofirmans PsJN]